MRLKQVNIKPNFEVRFVALRTKSTGAISFRFKPNLTFLAKEHV